MSPTVPAPHARTELEPAVCKHCGQDRRASNSPIPCKTRVAMMAPTLWLFATPIEPRTKMGKDIR